MSVPSRPVMRYHGGKWRIAPWTVARLPDHQTYVEPFGGGASVLMCKPRVPIEVYNDLDRSIVTLFRVLRDPAQAAALVRAVELTPYAREEHTLAFAPSDDPVEAARRALVRGHMSYGSKGSVGDNPGFNTPRGRRGDYAASWSSYPVALREVVERLRGVVVEHMDAVALIPRYDSPETLFYVDPPYVASARIAAGSVYRHDMSDEAHRALATALREARGMVVLSGYASPLYDELYHDWHTDWRDTHSVNAIARRECLWTNDAARRAMAQMPLFEEVDDD